MSEFHDLDRRVIVLEQIAAMIERRFDAIDRRFDTIERRFDAIDRRFDGLRDELSRSLRWLLGLWFASLGAVLAVIAHGFHWL